MPTIPVLGRLLLSSCWLTTLLWSTELDRSGPAIALQSNVYQVGDKWHCPLCRQEVPHGDRSGVELKLRLSEWHDVYIEPDYFRRKIHPITDEELINSLRIKSIEPALRAALKDGDHDRISGILHEYFAGRASNGRLSLYDASNKRSFITADEWVREVASDAARSDAIVQAASAVYTPENGFTLHGVHWGDQVDFNHTYANVSKWGVHYLGFVDALINVHLLKRGPATAAAFERIFNQWYEQLDRVENEKVINVTNGYDFIWYELGLSNRTERLINAQRTFVQQLSPESNKRMLKNILGSARWLEQCLTKTPFHPYNWQTHTAHTLSYAALAFPEFAESGQWLDHGRKNMIEHLEKDILDDGGYVERTTSYASYMFSVFYRYMLMHQYFNDDRSLLDRYLGRLEKFIEFYVLTNTPVGVNVPFNDASRSKDLVPLFTEMGRFFGRGDFVGAVRHEIAADSLAALPLKVTEPKVRSVDFPDSRFVVMRDSWNPRSYFMMVNYGDFQNHSHYDQLAFEIYANGRPIALDAGLGKLGYLDPGHVSWNKHPLAHNMLTINQAVPEKLNQPGYDKIWSPQQQTEFFAATHDGYLRYQMARHRRHIVFSKAEYWLIIDEVDTRGSGQEMDFNLHTPDSMREIADGYGSIEDSGFVLKHDRRAADRITKIKSSGNATLGGLPNEPSHRDIDWLVFRQRLAGDRRTDRMATLIYPYAARGAIDPASIAVERLDLPDDATMGYRVLAGGREDLILVSDGKFRRFTDAIEGDFKYARIRTTDGVMDYAGFVDVGRIRIQGVPDVRFPAKRDHEYKKE